MPDEIVLVKIAFSGEGSARPGARPASVAAQKSKAKVEEGKSKAEKTRERKKALASAKATAISAAKNPMGAIAAARGLSLGVLRGAGPVGVASAIVLGGAIKGVRTFSTAGSQALDDAILDIQKEFDKLKKGINAEVTNALGSLDQAIRGATGAAARRLAIPGADTRARAGVGIAPGLAAGLEEDVQNLLRFGSPDDLDEDTFNALQKNFRADLLREQKSLQNKIKLKETAIRSQNMTEMMRQLTGN